ncbi:hypothetical protein F3Y22_tig00110485pilonHSYRG00137 [Hibiscus syriacus]|nr:hypothetical protein F3Y22_tig00110485pilonHSYRG00134 [Hibiscus syriacus]KAE8702250.1 hypothetical protein F3Y22_tig00110485pilonHSYRG00137 [Hibiscus syriacus]
MAAIGDVNLAAHNEERWRFRDRSHTLPGGRVVLRVTDGSNWWTFECRNERDDVYCISGSDWRRFARSRMGALVTLYSRDDGEDFHMIRVR